MRRVLIALVLSVTMTTLAQQRGAPTIPRAPFGDDPFTFDTAEQHKIRLVVVTKGLSHPYLKAGRTEGSFCFTDATSNDGFCNGRAGAENEITATIGASIPANASRAIRNMGNSPKRFTKVDDQCVYRVDIYSPSREVGLRNVSRMSILACRVEALPGAIFEALQESLCGANIGYEVPSV